MQKTFTVSGRVDPAGFGPTRPSYAWVELHPVDPTPPRRQRTSGTEDDFAFEVDGLSPGRYRVEVSAVFPDPESGERWSGDHRQFEHKGVIDVTSRDVSGVVLVPVPKKTEEAEAEPEGKR